MTPADRYLGHLRARKLSPTTVRTARQQLGRLEAWANPTPIEQLDRVTLGAWQADLADAMSSSSLRTTMAYVRGFYRWCVAEEILTVDPTLRLVPPRDPRRLPRPMSDPDFVRALDSADDWLRPALALARFAGLRACEITGLDWADVNLHDMEPYLRVEGKGGHERLIDLAPVLVDELKVLAHRRGPVLRRIDGRTGHVNPNRLSQFAGTHFRAHHIPGTFHSLRHAFGTAVYAVSKDIRATQEAMGHASPRTTALYVRVSRSDVRAAVLGAAELRKDGNPSERRDGGT